METLITVFSALVIGIALAATVQFILGRRGVTQARLKAIGVIEEAEENKRKIVLQAKEEALNIRSTSEKELRDRRSDLNRTERRLNQREEQISQKNESTQKRHRQIEAELDRKQNLLDESRAELEEIKEKEVKQLEIIAGVSISDAKNALMKKAEEDIKFELAKRYRDLENEYKNDANNQAKRVLTLAIHRLASDVVSENSTSTVKLPNDEMKGRLIGREGRNIRAIEAATGVDLIIDDTPEAVSVSCFDPIRREVAKIALTNLVADGRIHPARIEDIVEKAQEELDETIWQEGERAVFETRVRGMNSELIRLIGRLKYRYSYGENILQHSIEVSNIAGMLAAELGANIEVAKAGGLLHDIGKALTHEVEGTHAEIGADVAQKHGISEPIWRAIMEHHDEDMGSIEAFIVAAADAVSAARPGSRKDTLEHYVKRLEALEAVANEFPGIERSFAIQAGREIRIVVQPDSVDDSSAAKLARDVANKIQDTLAYPGQIKVTVIRETRNVEIAT